MDDCLDLELDFSQLEPGRYSVQARATDPQARELRAPERGLAVFDQDALRGKLRRPVEYGQLLFDSVFQTENVRRLFDETRAIAAQAGRPLRLRVFIERDALALHDLRWETLNDARPGGGWLLTRETLRFSRFLSSHTWEAAAPRAEGVLRALVFIANPSDLAQGRFQSAGRPLAPVDVAAERARAQAGLGALYQEPHVVASDPAHPGNASLDALRARLREGFDILYLVCHGTLRTLGDSPGPQLLLEKADGTGELAAGNSLVEHIRNLAPALRPRLVVLASCQSAGAGLPATADDDGMLAAVGPQLAMAGVPAVLAMQGSVMMATVAGFMPAFFRELLVDGQIDRALAVARAAVNQQADAWMPVLFLRLRDGSLWYKPHFGGQDPEGLWDGLLLGIGDQGRVTPIIGPGLSEPLWGTPGQVARAWAEEHHYPLSERSREELPQVAQYLSIHSGLAAPRRKLVQHLARQVEAKFGAQLPPNIRGNSDEATLELKLAELARLRHQAPVPDNYGRLARLPFHVYITTNPDNLLVEALRAANRPPVVDFARWKDKLKGRPSEFEAARAQNYTPSFDRPLVFHLCGVLRERESLILSEDDYFDYLMWVNQLPPPLPGPVGDALTNNGLLFLGFGIQEWSFRLLFRSLLTEQRRLIPREYRSLAVQVQPGGDILEPEQARRYLERHLSDSGIGIFWGSVDDFMTALWDRAKKGNLV
jgi:hypothetical protein